MMSRLSLALALWVMPSAWAAPPVVLFLGDSLTEGYGVAQERAFPVLVEKALKTHAPGIKILHAGIGGSTSASGVGRLKWHLKSRPTIMVLALGANDGLRGLPVKETKKSLAATIELAQKNKIKVVLAGMKAPPNYGPDFTRSFESMYRELAKEYKLTLIPFLLEGVAGDPKFNLSDGIHPNEKGHEKIAELVGAILRKQL